MTDSPFHRFIDSSLSLSRTWLITGVAGFIGSNTRDVRHSQADIRKAQNLLGYVPTHHIGQGLQVAMKWYVRNLANA